MGNGRAVEASAKPMFESYSALAQGLIADLAGICLLDGHMKSWGEYGNLNAAACAAWFGSLDGGAAQRQQTAGERGRSHWWVAIPIGQTDGRLLGVFFVSQIRSTAPPQPSYHAEQIAKRLKPLLECIHRDLVAAQPAKRQVQQLTERAAELEWLFEMTSNLKTAVDDKHMLDELLAAATRRMGASLGVLSVPDKRVLLKHETRGAAAGLHEAWLQTEPHLTTWAQRQNRPLVTNRVGTGSPDRIRCKVLAVPVVRDTGRVIGVMAFYNPPEAEDFMERQVFLARHIGRQAAGIIEAQFDLMTGLYTRAGLDQMYLGVVASFEAAESSVVYLDIDHMHVANELHGFELGNELIVRVADLLTSPLLPANALAARIAGDRFAFILPACNSAQAMALATTLQAAAANIVIGPQNDAFDVSISGGVSILLPMPDGLARGIAAAELACKTAKQRGRNRIELYAFEDSTMMRRHSDAMAVGQLRSALRADRLVLFAQRIAPLRNRSLPGGYELLLRMKDVDGSLVAPGPLIDAAQRYQLLPAVDRWVTKRALQTLAPYRTMLASRGLGISINVSGQSVGDEAFALQFAQQLREARLPRDCVSVELTEQAAVTNLARANQMVTQLATQGCRFALDDFGTGSNSLTYLKSIQVYRVKIDGSFVRDVLTNRNSQATVRAVVELARGLGIETVAEYVESEAIANAVRAMGVDYAQGYAYGKPEPLDALLESLVNDESARLRRAFLET